MVAILVGVLSTLPFLRSSDYGVVSIDDYDYVVEHREVADGFSALNLRWMFNGTKHGIFMPLTLLSYTVDGEVAGWFRADTEARDALSYRIMHVHGALLHGVNAALVFVFLFLLLSAVGRTGLLSPALAALLWSLHPLRVESVIWIASRKDLVSFFWLALGLIAWVRWRTSGRGYSAGYWLSLLFFFVGAFGKPSVMVFPGLVAVIDGLVLRCLKPRADGRWDPKAVVPYLLPLVLGLLIAVEATAFQNLGGAMGVPAPLWARVLNACVSYGVYLRNEVCPTNLAVQCMMQYPGLPHFLIGGLVIFGACMRFFFVKAKALVRLGWTPAAADFQLAGLAWFFGALVPFIGVAGFGSHAYADRFTYIPALGLSVIAAWWLEGSRWRPLLGGFAAVALGCLAWWQTGFWKDEPTLWHRTLAVDGERNSIANVCLGQYHFEFGHDVKESVRYFDRAFAVSPDFTLEFGLAYMNALCEAGEDRKACELYKAFQLWNDARMEAEGKSAGGKVWGADLASAHIALLLTDKKTGLSSAQKELEQLAKVHPRSQHTLYLKGRIAEVRGDRRGACAAWRETLDAAGRDGVFVKYRFLRDRLERRTEDGVE